MAKVSVVGIRLAGLLLLWIAVSTIATHPKEDKMGPKDIHESLKVDNEDMLRNIELLQEKNDEFDKLLKLLEHDTKLMKHVSALPPFLDPLSHKLLDDHATLQDSFKCAQSCYVCNNFVRLLDYEYEKEENCVLSSKTSINATDETFSTVMNIRLSGTSFDDVGVVLGWVFSVRDFPIDNDVKDLFEEKGNPDTLELLFASSVDPPPLQGFAVVIDTSQKNRNKRLKEVSLIYSTGKTSKKMMYQTAVGCDGGFHFWEERDDVDVDTASQLRVTYEKGKVTLDIDKFNTGAWKQCCISNVVMSGEFAENTKISVAAVHRRDEGTSNLDLMEMSVYDSATHPELSRVARKKNETDPYISLVERMEFRASKLYALCRKSILQMSLQAEHHRKKLDELEYSFQDDVLQNLGRRITAMESKISHQVDVTIKNEVGHMENMLKGVADTHLDDIFASAKFYFFPLVLITLAAAGVYLFSYVKYRELKKAHLC